MPTVEAFYNAVGALLIFTVTILGVITLLGFFGRYWWVFDLFSHFRVQYFFIYLTVSIIALAISEMFTAGMAAIFALVNVTPILPLYTHKKRRTAPQNTYRILLANVLQKNTAYHKVQRLIQKHSPDYVILIETNADWINEMRVLEDEYPFRINADRNDNYGVSLFSRIPPREADIIYFGDRRVPSIVSRFELNGECLAIVCTHPPPPKGWLNSRNRNQQLNDVAGFIRTQDAHVCLVGDLNITPWSPYFKGLLEESGLINSAVGFGIQPTWPVGMPLLRVPIDHCLVSSGIQITCRTVGPDIGSDHFPVLMDFCIQPN